MADFSRAAGNGNQIAYKRGKQGTEDQGHCHLHGDDRASWARDVRERGYDRHCNAGFFASLIVLVYIYGKGRRSRNLVEQ